MAWSSGRPGGPTTSARVAELADAPDLGSGAFGLEGSSPSSRTSMVRGGLIVVQGEPVQLSILVPVYNEAATVGRMLKAILDVDYPCAVQVVVVDDGSRDDTPAQLDQLDDHRVVIHRHAHNRGKGSAIRTAAQAATGDYM